MLHGVIALLRPETEPLSHENVTLFLLLNAETITLSGSALILNS